MVGLNKARSWGLSVAILGALACLLDEGASQAEAAGLLIADGGFGGVLEIEEHTVRVTLNNGVAVTEVNQVFRNTENRQVEALYTFPVPESASVAGFSMWIDGKEMVGEVVEKKRAREIYESYKQTRRDPGLLEQTDYKTFEMRIFPIAAGASQRVQIRYYQELAFDHDWATYVYPLATVTRSGIDARTTGKFGLTIEAKSEVPIVAMESPSHKDDFAIVRHDDAFWEASLETKAGDLNRDVVLAYRASRPRTGADMITFREPGEDGYFCLTLTAGEELAQNDAGSDYVFVLDISGSMANDGKLSLSRESVAAFLDVLGPRDRVEVMTFNVQPTTLFNRLNTVTTETKQQAREFLATQRARGGTVLLPALSAAYRYGDPDRTLNVVVLSDGMTEQRERSALLGSITAKPANARLFCIGVGNEVNRPLLEQLAQEAGGLAAFLSQGDDFQRQAEAFRRKLMRPAATNLRIEFDGSRVYDVEPAVLPNLYHGMPVRMYGRYRGSGPIKATARMDVEGVTLKKEVEIALPDTDGRNPEIERMWAWHRVETLLREADRTDSRSSVVSEIIRLGEGYSIATEYTSFIVLENDAEYKRWKIDRRNNLRLKRDREAHDRLLVRLEAMRQKSAQAVGPASSERPKPAETVAVRAAPGGLPRTADMPDMTGPNPHPMSREPSRPSDRPRGWDIAPKPKGSGAIDPFTAVLGLGLAAAAIVGRARRGR